MATSGTTPVAQRLRPVLSGLVGEEFPLGLRCWDGSQLGPPDAPATIVVRSPRALRRFIWSPNELGIGRAFVSGDVDVEGDVAALFLLPEMLSVGDERPALRLDWAGRASAASAAAHLGALGPPPPPPPEEVRVTGRLHAPSRDAGAVSHHYDVGNDFYALVLGPSLTYSCAYFTSADVSLEQAQEAKHELVCRKLGLTPGMRLLDVGCGWGGLLLHAAARHGVSGVGLTVSTRQAELARRRVAEAGLSDRVEIRLQDYRDPLNGPFAAVASIGMAEHVGRENLPVYAGKLAGLLSPGGRLLHHAITGNSADTGQRRSFLHRYVFPDGDLQPVGQHVSVLEDAGLEVRDVHALREHYPRTLRAWLANLARHRAEAVRATSEGRVRVWELYMNAAATAFDRRRIGVAQVLAVRPDHQGRSGIPAVRTV